LLNVETGLPRLASISEKDAATIECVPVIAKEALVDAVKDENSGKTLSKAPVEPFPAAYNCVIEEN
ncbi:MAG: hypothetical protein ACK55I_26280, partial [bacterium]